MLKVLSFATFIAVSVLALIPAVGWSSAPETGLALPDAPVDATLKLLREGLRDVQNADGAGAYKILKLGIDSPGLQYLNEPQQHAAYMAYASVAYQLGHFPEAYEAAKVSSEMQDAVGIDWDIRMDTASKLEHYDDSAYAVTVAARRWPEILSTYTDRFYATLWNKLSKMPDAETRHRGLGEALMLAHWAPSEPADNFSFLWAELARLEASPPEREQRDAALALIDNPNTIVQMLADKRFDDIVARGPAERFDVARAWKMELARLDAAATAHPRQLGIRQAQGSDLLQLGRSEEALSLADKAIALAKAGSAEKPAFDDMDQLIWAYDNRARALRRLGRYDEALSERKAAAIMPENGAANVSQVINLGDLQYEVGQSREALETVSQVEGRGVTSYGKLAALEVEVCAYAQLGDNARRDKALDVMRKTASEGPQPFAAALLCANRLDELAAFWIKLLDDPESRSETLLRLQDYRSFGPTDFDKLIEARGAAALARPDVQGAIRRYGRSLHYDFSAPFG